MEAILLEHDETLQHETTLETTATTETTISVVDTTGVVLIVVPFIVLIGLFFIIIVLCKRRLHRGIKIAKVGKTNHIQMMIQNQKMMMNKQLASSKKDAPRKTFGSKKEYEMTQSFSKYVWGIQEKVINTLSAVDMKHHQVDGFDSIYTQSRYALSSPSSPATMPNFRTPTQQATTANLKNSWHWKAEESTSNQDSPKPKAIPNSSSQILTPKRRTDAMESHLKTSQSFIDDDGLDEYTTIHNRRDNEALLQERKSLLETQPISYKQFIQHSIIIIEQAAGLSCDLPCNQLGITTRQIIEYIRDRVGFSQEDCERYLKFLEKASYSSEKTCITDREFELFSSSFLSILQQIDSYYLQTTLL
ncbi:predicted protein [Naegleria gruberi]|uniref:Predicted protein n=1 Tax=Naegleria gruberi TaxID=5762 RepID=D2VKV1_NAEGR|nr:uncharacterized protein NAEGRDRAFT_69561 [Naegleria gruberi]EFC42505.1 predicted protein [Naegleria gruberi]|eukprot:XP_002675249.1 predicted protein [Naegleria gruberi strain NEG-M]